ncbi:MAG: DUF4389 domain-containing protein [Chloroflexota bacterium]|nr:DUF4389 domain-containing protein [Chloroflexota bacterium]
MTQAHPYPLVLRGERTEPLSRWLWLVKWVLVVPHIVVLFVLFLGGVVVWVVALVAILLTGRYPRPLFDYMVGILRWAWRVGFYSYQALGTDRYPPFTLSPRDDYPADLGVVYPERLSRGLVLVKWWLLAFPHYLILEIFQGGTGYCYGGLHLLLVLFAAIALLFTGRYPLGLWEFIMGINHWAYRVAGYVLLLTDRYPPFRLGK